ALDERGLMVRLIPEWEAVRYHHQRNAYHRFTTDRHLLEAVAIAAEDPDAPSRHDLLLVGTLLHDIGKGRGGDHTEIGMEIVADLAPRMGFGSSDTAVLLALVEHHLLLADTATRRDLDDPATIELVGKAVGDHVTLELLAALTRADSMATGAKAWGPWKAGLVEELTKRTSAWLDGNVRNLEVAWMTDRLRDTMEQVRSTKRAAVSMEGEELAVAALDQPGLLAAITGVLAATGFDVRSCNTYGVEGVAIDLFSISESPSRPPSAEALAALVDEALAGSLDLGERIAQRLQSYPPRRASSAAAVNPRVTHLPAASSRSAVFEVRAPDTVGLLYRLTKVLFEHQLDLRAARVATVGDLAFDVFYLQNPDGSPVTDAQEIQGLLEDLRAAIDPA
ncbi:MAG: HD domain-containing protein, partial [Actinobacteria bacterium]|nr:HD domain-containing protein [Actinomycetota bacterium]